MPFRRDEHRTQPPTPTWLVGQLRDKQIRRENESQPTARPHAVLLIPLAPLAARLFACGIERSHTNAQ
jgi:hypothetical protein